MRRRVKHDGEASLAEALHLPRLAEELCARRNQQVLAVVGIDVGREQALDGPENWPSRR